jgi:hypothetical protein
MRILRFILPFLFVRNWHNGSWELSQPRVVLFVVFAALLILSLWAAHLLQAPLEYSQVP